MLYGCKPNAAQTMNACSYKKEGEGDLGDGYCLFKKVGTTNTCTCETDECKVVGPCDNSGGCPEATPQPDGTACHSIPW